MSHKSLISFSMMEKYSKPSDKVENSKKVSNEDSLEKLVKDTYGDNYKIVSVETVNQSKKSDKKISEKSNSNYGCLLTAIIILLVVLIVITILNSVQVIVPVDASNEEIREAFEEVYKNLLNTK